MAGIDLKVLFHSLLALGWCVVVLVAVLGWGSMGLRMDGVRHRSAALNLGCGFALAVFWGGLADAAHQITRFTSFLFIGIGLVGLLWGCSNRWSSQEGDATFDLRLRGRLPWSASLLLLAACVVLGVRLLAATSDIFLQPQDDCNYYLAAQEKVLVTHHFGPDPFSERRAVSTVGGGLYLNSLVLSELPLERAPMVDRVFGLLFVVAVAFALWEEFELTATQGSALVLLMVATTQIQLNITYVMLPEACFFALPLIASTRRLAEKPLLRAALLGAMAAVVTSTKSSYIVPAAIFLLLAAVAALRRQGARVASLSLLVASVVFVLTLLPWLIMSRVYAATFFYPLLGHGFHYSAYHQLSAVAGVPWKAVVVKVFTFVVPISVVAIAEFLLSSAGMAESATILTMTAVVASVIVGLGTGGDSMRRYNYPVMLPAMVMAYPVFCARARLLFPSGASGGRWKSFGLQIVGGLVAVAVVLDAGFNHWTHEFHEQIAEAQAAVQPHDPFMLPAKTYTEYAALNAALPASAQILATVRYGFLLDFEHHDILLADWPGAAGLPEGWPVHGSGDELAAYLLRNNVRYVMYSYGDEAAVPAVWARTLLADPANSRWLKDELTASLNAHRQYAELAVERKRVFDDGQIYVLDLACAQAGRGCEAQ